MVGTTCALFAYFRNKEDDTNEGDVWEIDVLSYVAEDIHVFFNFQKHIVRAGGHSDQRIKGGS